VHEADEPNGVVDFLDAEFLTGEHGRDIDLFSVHADCGRSGDRDVAVIAGIFESGSPS